MARSRRSGAPAIVSRADPFRAARRRLTLLYIATLAAVIAVLSSVLYELHSRDVEGIERERSSRRTERAQLAEDARSGLEEYLERLGRSLIIADIVTLVTGSVLSYLLAARTLQPIKESVQAEQRFFANAAHDLRTPLAVMRSEAEVALRAGSLDEGETRAVIASSLEEIRRMSSMVEQMLDLARSGKASRPAGSHQPLDLSALAADTAARLARRAAERGIRMITEAPAPVRMAGDSAALERAAYNILENAIAYTPSGGCVTVRVSRAGGDAVLAVIDTGMGIPPDDLPHITEPFFRGDKARGAHTGGAGLGLTIVKTTTDEHRGTFRASSRLGGGTTITLAFPAL